jgi:hypothetical protein
MSIFHQSNKGGNKMPRPKKTQKRAKKSAPRGKPKSKSANKTKAKQSKGLQQSKDLQLPIIRRPSPNPQPDIDVINMITTDLHSIIEVLDNFAANLRALDRMRHNGVGLKRLGFIEAAFRIASQFPQYYPHWLSTAKFQADLDLFNAIRELLTACRSLEEKAWNVNVESADMIYTNALEYYAQVQDAANRRIDSAESLYAELHGFFSRGPMVTDQPTEKQVKRDFNSVRKGKKDGVVTVRNISPKTTGGNREVIDETFKSRASFKETGEGSISE